MDPLLIGTLLIGLLVIMLVLGTPIAVALASTGIVGVLALRPWSAAEYLLANFPYSYSASFSFIVLPLFLFMGYMAFEAGLASKAFDAGQRWLGHIPGGLAIATVFGCAAFSAVCGSSVATASTMARSALPEMLKRGYRPMLGAGCVAAGGTLGVLIPPSGILVVYSFVTEVSLVKLFIAAVIPGVLTAVVYMTGIYLMVKIWPSLAGPTGGIVRSSWRERFASLGRAWEVVFLFAVVMGSIYLGIATATEAAAVGAFFAMLVVLFRPNAMSKLKNGLWETGTGVSTIFFLIVGAGLFSMAISLSQLPVTLAAGAMDLGVPRYVLFALIVLVYLVLGCLIDGISMVLITMPIVFPIIQQLGYDPVWFGIIIVKAVEIGCITPPVGLNAYVVKAAVPEAPIGEIFKGCAPFVVMELLIIALMTAFPEIVLALVPR